MADICQHGRYTPHTNWPAYANLRFPDQSPVDQAVSKPIPLSWSYATGNRPASITLPEPDCQGSLSASV